MGVEQQLSSAVGGRVGGAVLEGVEQQLSSAACTPYSTTQN